MSYAHDMARDRWLASPEYAKLVKLCERFNTAMGRLKEIECGGLTIEEMRFILNLPESINVSHYTKSIPLNANDVLRLEKLAIIHGVLGG